MSFWKYFEDATNILKKSLCTVKICSRWLGELTNIPDLTEHTEEAITKYLEQIKMHQEVAKNPGRNIRY